MWMTKFKKYSRPVRGRRQISTFLPVMTAGVAWDVMPTLTLMVDYKHIFYGSIPVDREFDGSFGTGVARPAQRSRLRLA